MPEATVRWMGMGQEPQRCYAPSSLSKKKRKKKEKKVTREVCCLAPRPRVDNLVQSLGMCHAHAATC
jgi:hypothetical protein